MKTTVLILGAGCSVACGYPLAANMFTQLSQFKNSLHQGTAKLQGCIAQTLRRVEELRQRGETVDTLDTLVRLLHQGKGGGQTMLERSRFVEDAKLSVAALFLSLEREALQRALPGYRQLLARVFGDDPHIGFRKAIADSCYRILTFNYDRLFELAFRQYFQEFHETEALYCPTVLNSGLYQVVPEKVEVDRSKFSFLKLHGSAGFWGVSSETDPSKKDTRIEHISTIPDPLNPPLVTDADLFFPDDPALGINRNKARPILITFPDEKDHLKQYPNNLLPFKAYTPTIWDAAQSFVSQAEEIHIVGYSCPDADADALRSLFAAAKSCRQYVIENSSSGDVSRRLWLLLPQGFSGEVVCETVTFGYEGEPVGVSPAVDVSVV